MDKSSDYELSETVLSNLIGPNEETHLKSKHDQSTQNYSEARAALSCSIVDIVQPQTHGLFRKKLYPQWISAVGVILLLTQLGGMSGWTSPYLSRLTASDSPIFLTPEQASWMASLLNVGRFFGSFFGALFAHLWGSKKAIILTLLPMILNWILILLANCPIMLYIARTLGGLGLGMIFSCFPLFVGEIALPEIRGAIITLAFFGSAFSNVLVSVVGYYLSVSMSSIVFLVPCLIDLVLFLWLPHSPHYLVKIGDSKAAEYSIYWYRSGEQVEKELKAVQDFVLSATTKSREEKIEEIKSPPIRRAIFIVMMLFIYLQICGLNTIIFYMEIIFQRGKFNLVHPSIAVVLVTFAGALTLLLSVNMMDLYGRRILLIVSASGVTVSMLSLGSHFLFMDFGFDPVNFQWLVITSLILFISSFNFGLMVVPSTILSEMFPVNIKTTAACISNLVSALMAFAATKAFQPMVDLIGDTYVFYIHAVITATAIPFVLYFLPETKGKSLQQIRNELTNS